MADKALFGSPGNVQHAGSSLFPLYYALEAETGGVPKVPESPKPQPSDLQWTAPREGGVQANIMEIDSEKCQNFIHAQGAGQAFFFPNGLGGEEIRGVSIPPASLELSSSTSEQPTPVEGGGPSKTWN